MHTQVRFEYLDNTRCRFFKGQRLQHDVISLWQFDINQRVLASICLKDVGIDLVANFTSKGTPVERPGCKDALLTHLGLKPVFETGEMHIADTTRAFTNGE